MDMKHFFLVPLAEGGDNAFGRAFPGRVQKNGFRVYWELDLGNSLRGYAPRRKTGLAGARIHFFVLHCRADRWAFRINS